MKTMCICIVVLLCAASCKNNSKKNNDKVKSITDNPITFCKVVKELNNVVLEGNFSPVVASRNYAYASIAAYECISAGNTSAYKSLAGRVHGLTELPKPASNEINYNLAATFAFIKVGNKVTFPEGSMMDVYNKLKDSVKNAGLSSSVLNATIAFSDTIAGAIIKWSTKDNYAETRSAERFTVTDFSNGRWVETPPMYAPALEYKWNTIRTLVIDSAAQFMPKRPPAYNITDKNSAFYKAMEEVAKIGNELTDEQKHMADFFDDNPFKMNVNGHVMYATKKFSPPGHWMNIVGIAAEKSKFDFAKVVQAYAYTSIALFDGFISCWDEKYRSVLVRPETVINKYISQNWRPYIQTPPFPSYTSGHSVTSAAAAEMMTSIFGDNFSYTDTSQREFGIADRSFKSFRHAAQEASLSRLYGGIHYRFDLEEGAKQGAALGKFLVNKLMANN